MIKKLILLSLVPMTLMLQGAFVMKKGQTLEKIDAEHIESEKPTPIIEVPSTQMPTPTNTKPTVQEPTAVNIQTKNINILTIGDSFTDGSDILIPLKAALDKTTLQDTYLGTRSDAGIAHEGRAGWTADAYMNLNPKWYPDSPFLHNGQIDFKYYFDHILKAKPNIVIIQLGVNDMLSATKGIAKGYYKNSIIQAKVDHLALLAGGVRKALPLSSKILMLMPTPPSSTNPSSSSGVNHQEYMRVYEQYRQYYLSKFKNREKEGILVIGENLNMDTQNGFIDYVHPNKEGYTKIAEAIKDKILSIVAQ